MSDGVSAIGSAVSSSAARAASVASVSPSFNSELTGVLEVKPISPVINMDPVAGVLIMQYLGTDGQLQTQIPSAASVAYLRVGLTESGELPKEASPPVKSVPQTVLA